MATQYADVNSLPNSAFRDYILSYADMWDHYVIYQSGPYEYTGYIWDNWENTTLVTITRESTSGYNTRWRSDVEHDVQHTYTIIEPMYAYSTEEGQGQYYMPQNSAQVSNISMLILATIVAVVLIFRRVFKI